MQIRNEENRYFIVLKKGEEIIESVTQALKEHNIQSGTIMGIGAASDALFRYYDVDEKKYFSKEFEGKFEITSMTGNVSLLDGEPWPHIHAVFGDTDYSTFGGHLSRATVGVTCEIVIDANKRPIERALDAETGLNVWCLIT